MESEKSEILILPLKDIHADYLKDESRLSGQAESISFPQNEAQIQTIVKTLSRSRTPITVQGSRTGITGGAVPVRGHIMNLSQMDRVTGMERDPEGNFLIRVQPGIILSQLDHQLNRLCFDSEAWDKKDLKVLKVFKEAGRYFWPPDPSEDSASVGGVAAGNSRGICAYHYGPARDHIKKIRVVDGNGQIHSIARDEYLFSNDTCPLPQGGSIQIDPAVPGALSIKDLMNLYLGSQGMLGVITELALSLKTLPSELWGIVFFFQDQKAAVNFIQSIHQREKTESATDLAAIEFMDHTTLEIIREFKQTDTRLKKMPDWDTCFVSSVYVEIHGSESEEIETLSEWLLDKSTEFGSDPDITWAFCGKREIEQARLFRHAAPEAVNQLIDKVRLKDSRITKLGTDMAFKKGDLSQLMEMYCADLKSSGLKAAIFGHAAEGHLHVNILPRDYQQFEQGKKLVEDWAKKINSKGGSIVTEHGIGKIKKYIFQSIPLPGSLKIIRSIKQQLDPEGLWNPGNMFDSFSQQTKTNFKNGNHA